MAQATRRKRSGKKTVRSAGGHPWGMLVIGLISGSVLAALLLGSRDGSDSGFGSGLKTLFERATAPDSAAGPSTASTGAEPPRPKLDFYTVLPRIERILPDDPPPPSPASAEQGSPRRSWYVLQVASYQSFQDADRLRAQLILSGLDAAIQKVTVEDKEYFRVRLGPYDSQRELKNVKQSLGELGYAGISLKISEP